MKATTILIATVLTLQVNVLFAHNDNIPAPARNESFACPYIAMLAPVAPLEASFEEIASVDLIADLMPVTPTEATFEDADLTVMFDGLAPVEPMEATFEDAPAEIVSNFVLAPATPVEADFE